MAADDLWKILAVFVSQLEKCQHWLEPITCAKPSNVFENPSPMEKKFHGYEEKTDCMFEGGNLLNLAPMTNSPLKLCKPGLKLHEL